MKVLFIVGGLLFAQAAIAQDEPYVYRRCCSRLNKRMELAERDICGSKAASQIKEQ